MVDGKFLAEDSTAPAGQAIVVELLDRCFLWSGIVLTRYARLLSNRTKHPDLTSTSGRAK